MALSARIFSIKEIRTRLLAAQDQLSREKNQIIQSYPLTSAFDRETYAFVYLRAERLGMQTVNAQLAGLSWLPMRLDTSSEILDSDRAAMKKWLKSSTGSAPEAAAFGNDFMHALARCALRHGWNTAEFFRLSARIAALFRDLSCLIGVAWYCKWFSENQVDSLTLSDPDNLSHTAMECAALLQSPELTMAMKAREQNNNAAHTEHKTGKKTALRCKDVLRGKAVPRVISDKDMGNTPPIQ